MKHHKGNKLKNFPEAVNIRHKVVVIMGVVVGDLFYRKRSLANGSIFHHKGSQKKKKQ